MAFTSLFSHAGSGLAMHIVAIGWLYVTLMMAISETSIVAGVMTFVMYGVFPVLVLLYISGSRQRKKKARQALLAKLAKDAASEPQQDERL